MRDETIHCYPINNGYKGFVHLSVQQSHSDLVVTWELFRWNLIQMVVVVNRCVRGQEANRGLKTQLFVYDMSSGVWRQIPFVRVEDLYIVFILFALRQVVE